MTFTGSILGDAAALVTTLFILRLLTRKTRHLPPGPPRKPLIGNLLDFPSSFDWETYGKWADQYGPVISLSAFGSTIVVINSYQKAIELLDKKSVKYSSRPYFAMAVDLMGWQNAMAFTGYGPRFRGYRKVFHEELGNAKALQSFYPQEESHAKNFIKNCLMSPKQFKDHCFHHAGAIVLRVAYGYKAKDRDDEFIRAGNIAMESFNEGCSPSKFMVNQMPILRYVPEWMPGAGFQTTARLWRPLYGIMVDTPFNFVKKELAAGTAEDSFTAKWLKKNPTPEEEDILKHAAGSMFGGGGETTAVSVYAFFLLMTIHPEIQKKAQMEMDRVVGRDRLPTFADRENLPYLEALLKETLRIFPSVPDGLPHATSEDDVHDGYFIPKGSIVISNIWKMAFDHQVYKDPETFNPERFIGSNPEQDPRDIVFGFGRRICPGRLLGDASLFITLAMIVSAFDIRPTIENGKPIIPELKGEGGAVNHVKPFVCDVVPRDRNTIESLLVD